MDTVDYNIAQRRDHLEIRGVSLRHLTEALKLHEKVRALQADHVEAIRDDLLQALMSQQKVSLTPFATLAQAQRLATHRGALLTTPVHTNESLRELRGGASESSTRTWLARRREANELFTVTYDGRTVIPAFQLDDGEPRPELKPILSTLVESGVRGWSLWTWLTTPTSFLSGGIPEEVARKEPERVLRAAKRFAAGSVA